MKLAEIQVGALKQRSLNETDNIAYLLKLKVGAYMMLTAVNINIEDRLVNSLVGKVG